MIRLDRLAASLIVVAVLGGVCSADQALYDPKWPIRLATTSGDTTVVLQSRCRDCKISLAVSRGRATTHSSALSATFGAPITLRIVSPSVALAIGRPTWFAYSVALFDIGTGGVIDEFSSYHPSISPDGKYLAFVQFYPQHGTPEYATTDIVRVYDVAYGAAGKYSSKTNNPGRVVSPLPPDGKMHRLESEIVWSSNSAFGYIETVDGERHKVTVVRDGSRWTALDGSRPQGA